MTRDEELEQLYRKLAMSQQMGVGFKDRIAAIQARIDKLAAPRGEVQELRNEA